MLSGDLNGKEIQQREDICIHKIPRGGNGNLLQYSCLVNPMDRGAWRATVLGFTKSRTRLDSATKLTCTADSRLRMRRVLCSASALG